MGIVSRLVFVLLFLFSAWSHGNDSSYGGDGSHIYSVNNRNIQMLRENIKITRNPQKQNSPDWKARCTFVFKNQTNSVQKVKMGFPDWKGFGDAYINAPNRWVIKNFKVKYKDQFITPKHVEVEKKKQTSEIPHFPGAYVWDMEFKPGEEITVYNEYDFDGFSTNNSINQSLAYKKKPMELAKYFFWDTPSKKDIEYFIKYRENAFSSTKGEPDWKKYEEANKRMLRKDVKRQWEYPDSMYREVKYIVQTGRTWKPPIVKATISFDLPKDEFLHQLVFTPFGYKVYKNRVEWTFENWVPKEDLRLYQIMTFYNREDSSPYKLFNNEKEFNRFVDIISKSEFVDPVHFDRIRWAMVLNTGKEPKDKTSEYSNWFKPASLKGILGHTKKKKLEPWEVKAISKLKSLAAKNRAKK